jgi:xanthine dehydrogenase accessory factor
MRCPSSRTPDMNPIYEALAALMRSGERAALATVVRTAGSTPQVPGAKILLREDGSHVGTIGGGRIEQVVLEALAQVLRERRSQLRRWHLTHDLGMCCGGQMEVFLEAVESAPQLVVFGAGHVALATVRLARVVGFAATVIDAREDLNDAARFPEAAHILAEPREAVGSGAVPWGPDTFVVIATHDHRLDEEALAACLGQPLAYLGMIGSRRKVLRIFERLRMRYPEANLDAVHAPIGLDIGAVTPEEIGVAILAELVAVRRKRAPASRKLEIACAGETG